MLISIAMVTFPCGGCLSYVMIKTNSKLASGTNIIGILIYRKIDLSVEWHFASFTPFNLFLKKKTWYLAR